MKEKEKGMIYKTSRIYYIENYVIVALLITFLYLISNYFSVTPSKILEFLISKDPKNVIISFIFLLSLPLITYFLEEPAIEGWIRQYILTKNEIIKVEGILRKRKISIPYQGIADLRIEKGILGRIFNFGNVIVNGFKEVIVMKGMRNPEEIYKIINYRMSQRQIPMTRKVLKIKKGRENE